ncbi:hypothetical protein QYE76_032159 [Lolium multiflorum]|uniref:CCHC-type domain-containing protein n=1 Tax=Lolium multiflorum TaxID=4521 RepID=A0AAD8QUI2_LOLMU|nr:hypothetical protein QYE76_032159 [Lolium multiflorum]
MARASKVSPSLEPYISSDDEVDDMEGLNVASLNMMGELVFHALHKKKFACSNFMKILAFAIESTKIIEKKEEHEREYANEIATLSEALKEQQTTNESLEETFTLELSMVKESRDRALEVAHDFRTKNVELVSARAKLLEDFELLKSSSRAIESELIKLTESHEQFKALNLIELAKLPSPCAIIDNACATNSTSCEASILKENVELRAQLALLTRNYEKLEESHGKLSSSHDDLLVSHDLLKLAHEAIMSKVKSWEIEELEAQVTSLKKDLVKGHEGKQSPNDKSGLGFNSNNKNKSTTHKRKKGHGHVKDPAKIVCFKCKIEGHHVRSCPLKKKPHGEKKQGKRPQDGAHGLPQGQAQGLPRLEERPLPKKDQAKAPVVEKSSEKKEKRRTCYICREKGHISFFCTSGGRHDATPSKDADVGLVLVCPAHYVCRPATVHASSSTPYLPADCYHQNLTEPEDPLPRHRWKGFTPEGALDGVDLSTPSEERTRSLRQEINFMVAHSLHRHSESLVNTLERVALRVIQEIMSHQYSPSGPALGTHQGELLLQSRPPLPFALAAPEAPNSSAYVVYKIGGDPSDYQFLQDAPKEIPHGYACAYVPDCSTWAPSNQVAIAGTSGATGGTSEADPEKQTWLAKYATPTKLPSPAPAVGSEPEKQAWLVKYATPTNLQGSAPAAITADQICTILKDQFGMMPKRKAIGYTKPYPNEYELIPLPPKYRLPDFTKFSGSDGSSSIEHVSRYLAQLGMISASDELRVRYFSQSLTGSAFGWYTCHRTQSRPGSSWKNGSMSNITQRLPRLALPI